MVSSISSRLLADDGPRWGAQALAEWLRAEPETDLHEEIAALQERLRSLLAQQGQPEWASMALRAEQGGLFCERALDACDRVKQRLLVLPRPLPEDVDRSARALLICLAVLAEMLDELRGELLGNEDYRDACDLLAEAGLRLDLQSLLLASMAACPQNAGLWLRVTRVWREFRDDVGGHTAGRTAGRTAYPRALHVLLGLAAAHPAGLAPRDLGWLEAYLEGLADALTLDADAGGDGVFWLDGGRDQPPVAIERQAPPLSDPLFYATAALGEQARADRRALEQGEDELFLPEGLTEFEMRALLEQLAMHWSLPPRRAQRRERSSGGSLEVCAGLRAIAAMSRGLQEPAAAGVAHWEVINASAGGYALMSAGAGGELGLGVPVALRAEPGSPWRISVVRWLHSPAPGQVELGLQLVGELDAALGLFLPAGETPGERVPVLRVRTLGTPSRVVLLAPAGCCDAGALELEENGTRCALRIVALEMRAPGLEMFRYEATSRVG